MAIVTSYQISTTVSEFFGNTVLNFNVYGSTVVGTGDGGFVLAYGWTNPAVGFAPLIDFYAAGAPPASASYLVPYGVDTDDVDMIGDPTMTRLANGSYAVVWDSATQGGADIRGAIFAADGTILHADFEVSPFFQDVDPEVAALANGNWVVVTDYYSEGARRVFFQIMSATGGKVSSHVDLTDDIFDYDASVCGLNDGGFAISWTRDDDDGGDVQYTVLNADGSTRRGVSYRATGGLNAETALAATKDGGFAMAFVDSDNGTPHISLSKFFAYGALADSVRVDPPDQDLAVESQPDIAVLSNGMILVTWTVPTSIGNSDIYARLFTDALVPVQVDDQDLIVITASGTNDTASSVAALLEGSFVTAWSDSQSEAAGTGTSIKVEVNQLAETLSSDGASDNMLGSALRSTLFGGDGNDVLDGGAGADLLAGGTGNDTYIVDSTRDRISETFTLNSTTDAGGIDTVLSLVTFSLSAATVTGRVENLMLGAGANMNATGNSLDNTLTGNNTANTLIGLGGDDTLNGGAGNDTLRGGVGDDTYIVSQSGDLVSETTTIAGTTDAGGTDTVQSEVSFDLDATTGVRFVENLTLTLSATTGFGNALNNRLSGNGGNNTLFGRDGNDSLNGALGIDTMLGGSGNDTYVVNSVGDRVFETTTLTSPSNAGGIDTVRSGVSFNLDASAGVRFVENLTLTGTGQINGSGNALRNLIVGNSGVNSINGAAGSDTLTGGGGADTFTFNTALGTGNIDRVTDYNVVADTIRLENGIFAGLGGVRLAASAFAANGNGIAGDASDRIVYEKDTGRLFFDSDGAGGTGRVHFATLATNLSLTNADFLVF